MTHSSPYMTVKEVAQYLHLNEKKVYQLASDGHLPATKVTGKWLFPRSLVDQWLLESSHHGLLTDRLLLAGSDDPLLRFALLRLMKAQQYQALYSYMPTGTQAGLSLLSQGLIDACAVHWGRAEESHLRHPGLIRQYVGARHWVLVHLYQRQQGLMMRDAQLAQQLQEAGRQGEALYRLNWVVRQEGAGAQRFLKDWLQEQHLDIQRLKASCIALTEQEVAAAITRGQADLGPGAEAVAVEAGLHFVPIYQESFDLVLPRQVFFRTLIQQVFDWLNSAEGRRAAQHLQGYDVSLSGRLTWNGEQRESS